MNQPNKIFFVNRTVDNIEVFKTDVTDPGLARWIVSLIHDTFEGCQANFDLEDCDRILRVRYPRYVSLDDVISLVSRHGVRVEMLEELNELNGVNELNKPSDKNDFNEVG